MRITILGLPGSGTRALADRLGAELQLPVLHLEDLCHSEQFGSRKLAGVKAVLHSYLKNPGWIMEGNYPALELEKRLKASDRIIALSPAPSKVRAALGWKTWFSRRKEIRRLETLFRLRSEQYGERFLLLHTTGDRCDPLEELRAGEASEPINKGE